MGTVHGGVLCDIADAAMGVAFASPLDADQSFTTLELKINFLRPVWVSMLQAKARVVEGKPERLGTFVHLSASRIISTTTVANYEFRDLARYFSHTLQRVRSSWWIVGNRRPTRDGVMEIETI